MQFTHTLLFQALVASSIIIVTTRAHSWIEQLTVIAPNGTFVGPPGYARGNVLRTSPGFSDPTMTYLIPPDGSSNVILPTDQMCMATQRTFNQTDGSPRLQAAPGAAIALRYQENGHVTLPQNQPGKPANRGHVYVYGTTDPRANESFLAIHNVWNSQGTGGDGRGVLLSVQNFDDGRCYQVNNGNISEYRQEKFKHVANQLMGANLWCQQDIRLPSNLPVGKPYTLYWVWDWPTAPHVDPNLPDGKIEMYTTCMDIDIVDSPIVHDYRDGDAESGSDGGFVANQPLDNAAIPSQFLELSNTTTSASGGTRPSTTSAPCSRPVATTFFTITRTITLD